MPGIVFVIAMAVGLASMLAVNVFMFMMIGKVNRKVAAEGRLRYVGVTPPELVRIFREYRRLYPDGRLHLFVFGAFGTALLSAFVLIGLVEAM